MLPPGIPDSLDSQEYQEFQELAFGGVGLDPLGEELRRRLSAIEGKLDALTDSVAKLPLKGSDVPSLRQVATVKAQSPQRLSVDEMKLGRAAFGNSPREERAGSKGSRGLPAGVSKVLVYSPRAQDQVSPRDGGHRRSGGGRRPTWWSEASSVESQSQTQTQSMDSAQKPFHRELSHAAWAVGKSRSTTKPIRFSKIRWQLIGGNLGILPRLCGMLGLHGVEVREGAEPWGWQIVHSLPFQSVSSLMIVLNSFFIGKSSSMTLEARMEDREVEPWLQVMETCFETFFVAELLSRLLLERCALFFRGPEWKWNLFDTVLVANSLVDMIIVSFSSSWGSDLMIARLLRVLRFLRLTRIMRVMRRISSVRLVLFSILDSMSSLFWCFVVLFSLIYVFAILFMNATAEHIVESDGADDEVGKALTAFFGGVVRSMVTLFQVITGGVDWYAVEAPLFKVNAIVYGPILWFFVFVMQFGVMNVVVGTFVATAADIASKDRDVMVKRELQQMMSITRRIRTFFQEADVDHSGTLTWEEFKMHLEKPEVKAYFASMDLDVSQAHYLFALLDTDGNSFITIDEFLEGCLRLKGQARNIDVHVLMAAVRKMSERFDRFMSTVNKRSEKLESEIKHVKTGHVGHHHTHRGSVSVAERPAL